MKRSLKDLAGAHILEGSFLPRGIVRGSRMRGAALVVASCLLPRSLGLVARPFATQNVHSRASTPFLGLSTEAEEREFRVTAGEFAANALDGFAKTLVDVAGRDPDEEEKQVEFALKRMERDMSTLDTAAGATPQLSTVEIGVLTSTVLVSFFSPYMLSAKVVEVLVPSMAALSASIGFSAEYLGKVRARWLFMRLASTSPPHAPAPAQVAVARGKEIAATTLQAAAEAELYLAQAERNKAIIPLCVGIGATSSAFALVAPALVGELATRTGWAGFAAELYLICPIFAILAASVAALASQDTMTLSTRAIGIGARRFASANDVGRTWLSATEQISASTERSKQKWLSFSLGVLPAPVIGVLCPGPISFRAIVAAAVAAAQCAYSLATAEYALAAAVEAVALKSRSAAVSDSYANQGARAGSILPFTSALSGLCAAVTVAVVEVCRPGTGFGCPLFALSHIWISSRTPSLRSRLCPLAPSFNTCAHPLDLHPFINTPQFTGSPAARLPGSRVAGLRHLPLCWRSHRGRCVDFKGALRSRLGRRHCRRHDARFIGVCHQQEESNRKHCGTGTAYEPLHAARDAPEIAADAPQLAAELVPQAAA